MWVNKVKQHTSQSIWEQKQLIHVWWSVTSCCKFSYCIPDVFGLQTDIHNFSKAVWHKGSSNNLWPSTKTHYSKCLLWWSYIKIKMTIFGTYMDSETLFNNYTAPLGYESHKLKITAINSNPGHMGIEQYDRNLRFKKINAQDINFDWACDIHPLTHYHTQLTIHSDTNWILYIKILLSPN